MTGYPFLDLCIILAFPALLMPIFRPELRQPAGLIALFALPFAFTERWFYPEYWSPRFLFDLVNLLGCGIEDLLFLAFLGSISVCVYPFVFSKSFANQKNTLALGKKLGVFSLVIILFISVLLLKIEMIYGSWLIMAIACAYMGVLRRDLIGHGLLAALLTTIFYSLGCLLLGYIYPDIFSLNWNTARLSGIYPLGIPLEEFIYAFFAGLSAAMFYPFIFSKKYVQLRK